MEIFIEKKSAFTFRGIASYDLEILGRSTLERMEENLCAVVLNEGDAPKGNQERIILYPAYPFLTRNVLRKFYKAREGSFAFEGGYVLRGEEFCNLPIVASDGLGISVFSLNDFACATQFAAQTVCERLRQNGVIVEDGATVDETVQVGKGTYLSKNVVLRGASVVGENCSLIGECCVIDSRIGAGTTVRSSQLTECIVGSNCTVGPYAYLRPFSEVGDGCRIGDFVELKNATIGKNCKISHHAYVGDATLGKNVNVGCGVVFANYNGKRKARSVVGAHSFIGSNCNIIAPVSVGEGVYVAAGTTLTKDLSSADFCIGRCRESVKEGGARKYIKE